MEHPYRIRPVSLADLDRVAEIEALCFSDPWSLAHFLVSDHRCFWVAELETVGPGRLAGYVIGRMVGGEAEILNVAVDPAYQRSGLGWALLGYALARFREGGVGRAFLEVRESNRAARSLYRKAGFERVGIRPGYYSKPPEDALVLALDLARWEGVQKEGQNRVSLVDKRT